MAPEAVSGRLTAGLVACCLALACSRGTADVSVTWHIEPTPPVAGTSTFVRLALRHGDGTAVRGANLRLEAHMSHPGMAPVTAQLTEHGEGTYEARLDLSMAGDWVFVVTGDLGDGRRITQDAEVPGVRPAQPLSPGR